MVRIRKFSLASGVAVMLALGSAATAAAAPVSVGHSGWTWGSPTPQGKNLNAVTFLGNTGYAVGDLGTALSSADGGATWSGLATGTTDDLSLVQELSPTTVIVGGGCTVAESTNSGASFTELPINASTSACDDFVSGLSFTSATTGYVEQASGQIAFTTDGGQSVQAKTPVPLPSGGDSAAAGLQFTSATTGFAVTGGRPQGTIQRTTDGANSWTQVASSPHGLNDITFVTATTAYAVGDSGTLLESVDGGATWTARPLTGAGTPNLTHISCSDALNCLISIADSRSLIRTTDGGATGTTVTPSAQAIADVAYATGTNVVGVGFEGATVLSANGGAQFPTLVSGGFQGALSDVAHASLRAGAAAGSAYLLAANGDIEATTDGGATWKVLRVPGGGDLVDVAFPSAANGFSVGDDDVLRKTANGGTTWSSLDAGVSNGTSLAATSASNVLLVGPVGIRRSTDGGQTFTKVSGTVNAGGTGKHKKAGPKVSSLKLGHALTVGHTVFVWSSTRAYESTNGGAAWKALPLPVKTKITDLSFVSPSTGYVLDAAGDVLGTRNTGKTWTKSFSLGTLAGAHLSFSTATKGMVALSNQGEADGTLGFDVLATTNGGKTWAPQLIDGGGSNGEGDIPPTVVATNGHAYYDDPASQDSAGISAVFATANGGASPQASHLSISIGPKKLTPAALKSKHQNRITVKGKLSPVTADGESVQVSYRSPTADSWHNALVRVATNGSFQVTLKNIKSTTDITALALGDGVHGGAGAYARLTVAK